MPGSSNLDISPYTDLLINTVLENSGKIGAICAAPFILGKRGLLKGKKAVCYPGFEDMLCGAEVLDKEYVVTDGNITTAKGMGVALSFAKRIAKEFLNLSDARINELSKTIMEK